SDFMTSYEKSIPTEDGIKLYCSRLAQIYLQEKDIGGLPMNMDNFALFDSEHRSSYPLNIAYKAALLSSKEKAHSFLYRLRFATIYQCRQTTSQEELLKIAVECGLDRKQFQHYMDNGTALKKFEEDLTLTRAMRINSLPSYLISYGQKAVLLNGVCDYDVIANAIVTISDNQIKPVRYTYSEEKLQKLIIKHPLISISEILRSFDDLNIEKIKKAINSTLQREHFKFIEENFIEFF
ncbi:MAG: DsbA family protein, partial [Succinivibrio dextrinosolvens]|nr:DsbA family protein [Succinivibrio dextrinosolvens]